MLLVFSLTIFMSAFLLFMVQPMFARMVLPILGGDPSVWNTALVFHQAVLLGGYGYAHATTRWLSGLVHKYRNQNFIRLRAACLSLFRAVLPSHFA